MKTLKYFFVGALLLSMQMPAMAQDVNTDVAAITKVVVDAKGDVATTKSQVKDFVKAHKKDAEALAGLGRAFMNAKNLEQAKVYAEMAIKANKNSASGYILHGDFSVIEENAGDAAMWYETATMNDPKNPASYVKYARIYQKVDPDGAVAMLKKLGEVDPSYPVDAAAGYMFSQNDRLKTALEYFDKVKDVTAMDDYILFDYATTAYVLEQYDKAIPLFKKALLANPEATGVYLQLGQCYYNAKKYRDSLPCFKRALDEDPGNKEALFHMADAMSYEGHPEKAIKVFMHLRADPTYGPRSCLQAGIFHLKTNEAMSAIQDLEIGLKHENIPPEIKIELEYNLARSYFEANMIPKGLGMLKTIRTKNANYKDVNTLISRYQELSQNSNLQIYISANSGEFATLCRKFISTQYRNSTVRIQSIDVDVLYTDILAEIFSSKWEDVALFRFFRTTGATGEIYVREFHGHMSDVKAARGFWSAVP